MQDILDIGCREWPVSNGLGSGCRRAGSGCGPRKNLVNSNPKTVLLAIRPDALVDYSLHWRSKRAVPPPYRVRWVPLALASRVPGGPVPSKELLKLCFTLLELIHSLKYILVLLLL
jgi:hypothetical protein